MRTSVNFSAMARMPSYRAPKARDILHPKPFTPPQAPALGIEEAALLAAVIANKDADAPRRQYAEWLIEIGNGASPQPIDSNSRKPTDGVCGEAATHCSPSLQPPHGRRPWACGTLFQNAQARGEFILAQLAGKSVAADTTWAGVFDPWSARDLEYHRGFVEAMSLSGRAFISLGAPLFEMTPLRRVRLVAVQPYLAELAACPHLALLEHLDLSGNHLSDTELTLLNLHKFCQTSLAA